MFRPITILGPLLALALAALSACSDAPGRRGGPAASPSASSAPAATAPATPAPATPAPRSGAAAPSPANDPSLRLGAEGEAGESCRARCDRSYNVCMDSVAARSQSGAERPDRLGVFTPTDNCQHSLRQCFQRCGSTR